MITPVISLVIAVLFAIGLGVVLLMLNRKIDGMHQENREANKIAVNSANAATALAVETRDWVNGMKRDVLEEHVKDLRLLVQVSPNNPDYKKKLVLAEARLQDHLRQQGKNDAKDVKVAEVQEQVRVDAKEEKDGK